MMNCQPNRTRHMKPFRSQALSSCAKAKKISLTVLPKMPLVIRRGKQGRIVDSGEPSEPP